MQKREPPFRQIAAEQREKGLRSISWDSLLFGVICFATLFSRFRTPALLLGSYQDDFFYYLQVARNIAATGVSTFNGISLTNGYHPLWMAALVLLYKVLPGMLFFAGLQAISVLSALCTYWFALRTLRLYLPGSSARCGAFLLGMEALMLIRYGMEVTLTVPLGMLLLCMLLERSKPPDFPRAAALGLVASLLILSRLDAGLLVALLSVALLLASAWRKPVVLLGFLCGVLPLLILYFAINEHYFHLLTPVSGLAKQMKHGYGFSPETWQSLLPTDRMRKIVLLPELLLVLAGFAAMVAGSFARRRGPRDPLKTQVLRALLLFPVVHLCTLSLLSDWNVWPWYFYSVTLAAVAAYILIVEAWQGHVPVILFSAYAAILVLYAAVYAWKGPNSVTVFQSSQQTAAYMDAHPGVYLMGDQAGTTAYLSHQPVIQTEGLVMDKRFLQLMRAATPLPQVAAAYQANYYVKIGGKYRGNCLTLAEPANAGPGSPMMRGTVCHKPLAVFYRAADNMPIRIFEAGWIR